MCALSSNGKNFLMKLCGKRLTVVFIMKVYINIYIYRKFSTKLPGVYYFTLEGGL